MKNKLSAQQRQQLASRATQLRIDAVRATTMAGSGHPTSCMSAAEIIAALFFHHMSVRSTNFDDPSNDRFILSKGHAVPIVYAAFKQIGIISDEELLQLRTFDSPLEGHPTPRFAYYEAATGSLGQGLAVGAGIATALRFENGVGRVFVLMGDAEIAEGSIWEAAQFTAHYKLSNVIGIVDVNRLGQSTESIDDHNVVVYAKKFEAFGWATQIVENGNDLDQVLNALAIASTTQPTAIIAKTFKGFGSSLACDKIGFHGRPFTRTEADAVINELTAHFEKHYTTPYHELPPLKSFSTGRLKQPIAAIKTTLPAEVVQVEKMAPRKAFGYALQALGSACDRIIALDGDVKNSTYVEIFEKQFPERTIQCFVAEQSMISVATGLERRGFIPVAATFAAFFTRAYDQLRMAAIGRHALHCVGSHCGVSIGQDGPSQMGLEDIALFRALPQSVVLYPADAISTVHLVSLMVNYHDGVAYLRTTRAELPRLYDEKTPFTIGGAQVLKSSENDIATIVAAGITVHEALKAYELLRKQNITVAVIDAYSIKPLDVATIRRISKKSRSVITVEDHYAQGGLGEAVAAALAQDAIAITILAVKDVSRSGKPEELLAYAGIDAAAIMTAVTSLPEHS